LVWRLKDYRSSLADPDRRHRREAAVDSVKRKALCLASAGLVVIVPLKLQVYLTLMSVASRNHLNIKQSAPVPKLTGIGCNTLNHAFVMTTRNQTAS